MVQLEKFVVEVAEEHIACRSGRRRLADAAMTDDRTIAVYEHGLGIRLEKFELPLELVGRP